MTVSSDTNSSVDGSIRQARVSGAQSGWRLDRFLTSALADLSRARLQALIAEAAVTLNDKTIKDANHRVKPEELYQVAIPPVVEAIPQGQDIPLNIVFEDKDLIVIDKQAGLVVHPAAGNLDGTLVNALIAHCGTSLVNVGGVARPGIVHRIDKDTTGLLVAAKNDRAMASLSKQFAAHVIERAYNAVVWGVPRAREGVIESLLARSQFDRKKMAVQRHGGKNAITRYNTLETFGVPASPLASLVECRLETGRTHQIRVHMTHLGHPLIGDATYGKSRQIPRAKTPAQEAAFAVVAGFKRQALHAALLGFQHPATHKQMRFTSDWPADFAGLVNALRQINNPD